MLPKGRPALYRPFLLGGGGGGSDTPYAAGGHAETAACRRYAAGRRVEGGGRSPVTVRWSMLGAVRRLSYWWSMLGSWWSMLGGLKHWWSMFGHEDASETYSTRNFGLERQVMSPR